MIFTITSPTLPTSLPDFYGGCGHSSDLGLRSRASQNLLSTPGIPGAAAGRLCLDAREERQGILELPLGKEHGAHALRSTETYTVYPISSVVGLLRPTARRANCGSAENPKRPETQDLQAGSPQNADSPAVSAPSSKLRALGSEGLAFLLGLGYAGL